MNGQFEDLELEGLGEYEDLGESGDLGEYEDLGEFEGLGEFEDLESGDLEEPELEDLGEYEDMETVLDRAKRTVRAVAKGPITPPKLKKIAQTCAKAAGAAVAGKKGAAIAAKAARQAFMEADMEGEYETDTEYEIETMADHEAIDQMEYYAARAADTESEAEADQFLPILFGAAKALLPQVLPAVGSLLGGGGDEEYEDYEDLEDYEADQFLPLAALAAPLIGKGVAALGRTLLGGGAKQLIRAVPKIARGAIGSLFRRRRRGRRITRPAVAATLGRQIGRVVGRPSSLNRAMRQNRVHAAHARRRGAIAGPGGLARGVPFRPMGRMRRSRYFIPVYRA